jgi:hypothetical protein
MSEFLKYKAEILDKSEPSITVENRKASLIGDSEIEKIIQDLDSKELIKGVLLSEILGKPLSKRRRGRRR